MDSSGREKALGNGSEEREVGVLRNHCEEWSSKVWWSDVSGEKDYRS